MNIDKKQWGKLCASSVLGPVVDTRPDGEDQIKEGTMKRKRDGEKDKNSQS